VPVLMLAILWTKETSTNGPASTIRVRAHGSMATVPSPRTGTLPVAMQACIALPPAIDDDSPSKRDWTQLPNRYEHFPDAKDSSWCAERRPLEEMYKADGIGEVILARAIDEKSTGNTNPSGIELLEGLTSNLFVVYKDGTLRTVAAGGNVLSGYARHLVLEAAKRLGIPHDDTKPVLLQDAIDGLWSEVFLTSSIRLMVPVNGIVLPEYVEGGDEARITAFRQVWTGPATNRSIGKLWVEALYQELFRAA